MKENFSRREFIKACTIYSLASIVKPKRFEFDWKNDVPPSLMLHSANIKFFPELIPLIQDNFFTITYEDWKAEIKRRNKSIQMISRKLCIEEDILSGFTDVQYLDKLPLIISIDDVGTSWIRKEHLDMFEYLDNRCMRAVIGIQPDKRISEYDHYWQILLNLSENGWELATHTITHPPLTRVSKQRVDYEVGESCNRIEEAVGRKPITLIAPFGDSWPPTNYREGNMNLYKSCQNFEIEYIAGIAAGRTLLDLDSLDEVLHHYEMDDIPKYVGRVIPDSNSNITLERLLNFKIGGYS